MVTARRRCNVLSQEPANHDDRWETVKNKKQAKEERKLKEEEEKKQEKKEQFTSMK
jgi:hypothetical protein